MAAIIGIVAGEAKIDWTGVEPSSDPIDPLTAATFVSRLESLTAALAALERLERAFVAQNPTHGARLPEPSRAPR